MVSRQFDSAGIHSPDLLRGNRALLNDSATVSGGGIRHMRGLIRLDTPADWVNGKRIGRKLSGKIEVFDREINGIHTEVC